MRAILLASFIAAAACSTEPQPPPPAAPAPTVEATPVTASSAPVATPLPPSSRPRQKVGQICAGIAGLRCEEGLHCVVDGPIHPDVSGICQQ